MDKTAFVLCALVVFCAFHHIQADRDSQEVRKFNGRIHHPREFARKQIDDSEEDSEELESAFVPRNNISERCEKNSVTPVSCPTVLPEDRLMAHPDDCHLFYYCVSNSLPPICRECPAELHFNPIDKVCDYPQVAGCQTLVDGEVEQKAKQESSKSSVCEGSSNDGYADLRPDPEDCSRYYVCDWGRPIHMTCPAGLHFSNSQKVCVIPSQAYCQVNNP